MSYVIHSLARIIGHDNLVIGDRTQIDDFVFLNAGKGTRIGRHVHIASFVSIIGGGELDVGDFAGIAAGARIVTGTDDFSADAMTGPTVPPKYKALKIGKISIGRHALIGTNAVVMPGVTVGDGAVAGAGCIVRKDLKPWTVYVGQECRAIRKRPNENIIRMEQELAAEEAGE
jgi:galactoside O-acetyltransferase